jgi:hypothetical protein
MILALLTVVAVLLIPTTLKLKSNLDNRLPVIGVLPELITVNDKLYFREGCYMPADLDNCDEKPGCYTQAYLVEQPGPSFEKLSSISYLLIFSTPVFTGPAPVRPSVYIPYGSTCFIRFKSVAMG